MYIIIIYSTNQNIRRKKVTQTIEKLIGEVDKLDVEIFELNQTIADRVAGLQNKKAEVKELLDKEIYSQCAEQLADKDYGCGTANIETTLFKIKTTVSKKVKWDEALLRNVADDIRLAGRDPEVYIKYKLSVSETAFKGFPDNIQQAFLPARSVEPSAPKITIERK